jgi:formate hydrogenlyase subunit 4
MTATMLLSILAALVLSPLMNGVINKTKAFFAGRTGRPVLQVYYDLFRLMHKATLYSGTTSWLFRLAPAIIFTATLAAAALVPFLSFTSDYHLVGDTVLILYLLGISRFFLILSALDTGSAFEGMGASREAFFAALAEPVLFISAMTFLRSQGQDSLGAALLLHTHFNFITSLMVTVPLFIVLLAENARIPFDDPNTHLELTMIHEVMILDNSGPGLALLEYAAALKMWLFALILTRAMLPVFSANLLLQGVAVLAGLFAAAVAVGVVEAIMARLRLLKVPQLLLGSGGIALTGFIFSVTKIFAR